jgi:hypothetical protein
MKFRFALATASVLLACCCPLSAQNEDPEAFVLEVTGSAWLLDTSGGLQSHGTPIDLKRDLGVQQTQPTFFGKLVFKFKRKERIVVEGSPIRLTGASTLDRIITFQNHTFSVSETISSTAQLDYAFVGYQHDLISNPSGHFGLMAGAAYLGASGSIEAQPLNQTVSKSLNIGVPLVGAEFRYFPPLARRVFEIDGSAKGLDYGGYGHYLDAQMNVGLLLRPLLIQAGYRFTDIGLHSNTNPVNEINPQFKGPIFSLGFHH